MDVVIGIDPHKASHTAVALDRSERSIASVRVRTSTKQLEQLLSWSTPFPERLWAIEGADGLGRLLAQQLVAAGERVVDVQPKLASRVRLLATGTTNKNDPNDARAVAVAAMRSPQPRVVHAEDHPTVLRIWAKRHRDLSRHYSQIASRLHALLRELVPGGARTNISPAQATRILDQLNPAGEVNVARHELARELAVDLGRIYQQRRDVRRRIVGELRASNTTLTDVFGVGPIVAATIIGHVGDISRFANSDRFAAYNGTAPIEVSSGNRKLFRLSLRGNRTLNHAIHMAAVVQVRHHHSPGRAYYDRKVAEGKTGKEALRSLKRRISDTIYRRLRDDTQGATPRGPGRATGERLIVSVTGSHPEHRLFDQATPEPDIRLEPAPAIISKTSRARPRST
jgi:transposase